MAAFSVILPHKRNPGNDAALAICLQMLTANTVNDFVLLMDAAVDAPLNERVNRMVVQATTPICMYMASDIFLAPGWDVPMLEIANAKTFVTGVLVEPGAIGVYAGAYERDFGRKPETFRRAEFEDFAAKRPLRLNGTGAFCPHMFPRDGWLEYNGWDESLNAPGGITVADQYLFERWKAAGNHVVQVSSYAYHLQRYSDVAEQEHEKRRA